MLVRRVIKQVWPYVRQYKAKVILIVLFSFGIAGLSAWQVTLIKPIFDTGLDPSSPAEEIYRLAALLLGIGLLHFPCRFFHFYFLRHVVESINKEVRSKIFNKFQTVPLSYFSKNKQGELLSRTINDSIVFSNGFRAVIDLLREPLKAIVYLTIAFMSDWQLAIVIIAVSPLLIGIFSLSGKKVKGYQSVVQEKIAGLTHNVAEGILAQKLTKAFNLQKFVLNRFHTSQNNFFNAQMKTIKIEELAHPLVEMVGTLAFCGVIVFAHYRMNHGGLTVGDFVRFVGALALFMDPIRKFSQANIKLSQAAAATERIDEVLSLLDEKDEGSHQEFNFQRSIDISNLSFKYQEDGHEVVQNLSIKIGKGEKVAIVGLSGSGKTTIINLLLGLYPYQQGEVKIDDVDIRDVKLKALRNLFGLVSQDIFLFNDSIRENLLLGKDFSEEKIKEALKVAYCYEFVNELPEKLDTMVGDRGMKLSGGQQQRLTIARAYLHDSPVLLFDEATSALDNESEKVVQKALENLESSKTVIAVAHRLTTIQHYDRIYVMKQGRVIEQGQHGELMQLEGEYAKLYSLSTSQS